MYSINPASRLTAVEYYYKNKDKFLNSIEINNWIDTIFTETPTIETLSGCVVRINNSRFLVEKYTTMNEY